MIFIQTEHVSLKKKQENPKKTELCVILNNWKEDEEDRKRQKYLA